MRAITLFSILIFSTPVISSFHEISEIKDVKDKKSSFFKHLYPAVINSNLKIMSDRKFLIFCNANCQQASTKYLQISKKYKSEDIDSLLHKVDIIPVDLALNQAANESAWGGSRFSKTANNLFGMWCFTKGCGITPLERPKGKTYELRKYEHVNDSIEHYMLTLNTNNAYSKLRDIRSEERSNNLEISAASLSEGLINYSQRREEYILEIKSMIRINDKFIDEASDKNK
jgi:Bax protein